MTKPLPRKTLREKSEEEKEAKVQNLALKDVVNLVTIRAESIAETGKQSLTAC